MRTPEESFTAWKTRPGRTALVALLGANQDRVYNICFQVLRHRHDAEEAAQEVLLEIVEGIEGVADSSHFERWVGKVAFRTALDRKRLRRRRSERELTDLPGRPDSTNLCEALHDAIGRLDEEDRILIAERYFDRLTLEDMGKHRDISAVAVRKRIEKARERLRRMLGGVVALAPGAPDPGSLLGKAVSAGVTAMKIKTSALAIGALLLVLLLGGGVWMAAARRSRDLQVSGLPASHPPGPSYRPGVADVGQTLPPTIDPILPANEEQGPDVDARRQELIEKMKRYQKMFERLQECRRERSRLWSLGSGAEELSAEEHQLEKEMPELYRQMQELAPLYPTVCLEFFQALEWSPLKGAIGRLLLPIVDSEIEADGSKPGPVLAALLPLALGDSKGRHYLARFAGDLKRGNRDLAQVCLQLLEDSDREIRYSAMAALGTQAGRGSLREFFAEHKARFQELATHGSNDRPAVFAFGVLAAVGAEDTDEFILQYWTSSRTTNEVYASMRAMVQIAPRVMATQEHRIAPMVIRALDLEYEDANFIGLVQLSLHLSSAKCVEALRFAVAKAPSMEPGMVKGLEKIILRVEAGEAEAVRNEIAKMRSEGAVAAYAIRTVGK